MVEFAAIDATTVLAALIGGGFISGIATAYATFKRAKPEQAGLYISSAEGAMKIVNSMTDALYKELQRKEDENTRLQGQLEAKESRIEELEARLRVGGQKLEEEGR